MLIPITNETGLMCDWEDEDALELCDADAVVVDTVTGERFCEEHKPGIESLESNTK